MKLTVKAGELSAELALLLGAIEKRTTIPILSNVLITASGDQISLRATDLELALTSYLDAKIINPGKVCCDLVRLADVVRALPKDDDVSLSVGDTNWISLACGKSKYKIAGMSVESYPEIPEILEGPTVELKGSVLAESLRRAASCICQQESRFTLNGALLFAAAGELLLAATDGHRMSVQKSECTGDNVPKCVVGKKAIALVSRVFDSESNVKIVQAQDKNHIQFTLGHRRLFSRLLTGNFPDYERVLPKNLTSTVTLSGIDLSKAIGRLNGFSDVRSHSMRFEIGNGELKLSASTSELGSGEEFLAVDYTDAPQSFGFNGSYIAEIGKHLDAFNWAFKDGGQASTFASIDGKSLWVVMPMRF